MKFIAQPLSLLFLLLLFPPQLLAMNQRHVPAHGIPANGQQTSQELKQIANDAQEASQQKSEDCPICLESMREPEQHALISLCEQHTFHTRCIAQAVKQSARCPLCRRGVSEEEQKKVESQLIQLDPEIGKKLAWEKRYGCLKDSSRIALFFGTMFALGFANHAAENALFDQDTAELFKTIVVALLGSAGLYILNRE